MDKSEDDIEYDQKYLDDIINGIDLSGDFEEDEDELYKQVLKNKGSESEEMKEKNDDSQEGSQESINQMLLRLCPDMRDIDDVEVNNELVEDIINKFDDQARRKESGGEVEQKKTFRNRLEEMEHEQRELCSVENKSLDNKFVLSKGDYIKERELDNMEYSRLERVSKKLFDMSRGGNEISVGFPRAIEMVPHRYIIVGTNTSYLCVFGWDELQPQILGGPAEQNYGPIVSLDVSEDAEMVVSAHELGQIVLWDIKKMRLIKTILGVHQSPVLQVKFYNKWGFISADVKGDVYKVDIFRSFFSYSVDKQLLLPRKKHTIYCIEVLKQKVQVELDGCTLCALLSMDMVLIVTLQPTIKIIHKIPKYSYIGPCQLPSVSWGRVSFQQKLTTVLAVGWGNTLQLVRFNGISNSDQFPSISYYQSDYDILYTHFLGDQFVLLIDSRKNIKILQTQYFCAMGEMGPGQVDQEVMHRCVVHQRIVDSQLNYQTYLKDKDGNMKQCFNNSVKVDPSGQVLLIGDQSIHRAQLFSWQDFVSKLVEKKDWLVALQLLLELYQGKRLIFQGIRLEDSSKRHQQMKPFLNRTILKYIDQLLATYAAPFDPPSQEQKETLWNEHVLTVIDFLVAVENFQFLFQDVKNRLERHHIGEVFIMNLEQFILKNKIKYMPQEICKEVIEYYQERNKIKVLQHLIINLDVHSMEQGFIISLCQQYKLYTSLIYVFTHCEHDFLSPLIKLYQHYLVTNKDDKVGLKILWYLHNTIRKQIYPQGTIEDDHYAQAIAHITNWLFSSDILLTIVQIDPLVAMYLILLFFSPPSHLQFLYSSHSLVGFFQQEYASLISNSHLSIDDPLFINQVITLVLNNLYQNNSTPEIQLAYFNFIANLDEKYIVSYDVYTKSVEYLIENINKLQILDNELINENNQNQEQKQQIVLKLIKRYESQLRKQEIYIRKLNYNCELNGMYLIQIYLMELLGEDRKCLEILIGSGQKQIESQVFSFIENRLQKVQGKEKENLIELVIDMTKDLVQIDSKKTRDMISNFEQQHLHQAIKRLAPHPDLQQQLLEKVIDSRNRGVQNIELLCQIDTLKLLKELKNNQDYPLDECYKICEQYEVKEAMAYLLERLGGVQQALDLYLEIIETRLQNILTQSLIISNKDPWGFLNDLVEPALRLCANLKSQDEEQCERLWFYLLDRFLQIQQQLTEQKNTVVLQNQLNKKLNENIQLVFAGIFADVRLKSVVAQIQGSSGDLKLQYFKTSVQELLGNYKYEQNILQLAQRLLTQDLLHYQHLHTQALAKATNLNDSLCAICQITIQPDDSQNVLAFNCHHFYHQKCFNHLDYYECVICAQNFTTQLDKTIYNAHYQQNRQSLRVQSYQEQKPKTSVQPHSHKQLALRKLKVFDSRLTQQQQQFDSFKAKFDYN